jgi:hypothetical protein
MLLRRDHRPDHLGDLHGRLPEIPLVHDPDDRGVGGHLDRIKRVRGLTAAHEEHALADAGAGGS